MRIRIAYETAYAYEAAPRSMIQVLRLTPRGHEGQRVVQWRLQADGDGRLRKGEDAFGNVAHTLTFAKPAVKLALVVTGEVVTTDLAGVVRGSVEPFPPGVFLRQTALTTPDEAVTAFAHAAVAGPATATLARLHALMAYVHGQIRFDTGWTDTATTAADTLSLGHGVCQDLTHLFVTCARVLGIPARYISGHLVRADGVEDQVAGHAWAEAYVDDLGWVGFDSANGVCPTDAHLRVATALDYLGASPVRGSRIGGGAESMSVRLKVMDAAHAPDARRQGQGQSQSQSQN